MAVPISLVAGPAIKKIISLTSEFISKEYDLVYGVEDEVKKIQSSLTAIESTLGDEDAISRVQQDWVTKLKDAALDAEDVLELYATKASMMSQKKRMRRLVALPLLQREAAQNIKKICARIADITSERNSFQIIRHGSLGNNKQQPLQAGPMLDPSQVCGRQDEKCEILTWLTSEEADTGVFPFPPVLSIVGMAGLGKTTLVQLLYNDGAVKGHFTNLIWIDARRRLDPERVGREMIEFVNEVKLELTAWALVEKRVVELLKGKKFLLVLDDLWEATSADWDNLHKLLRMGGMKGSRVLVTSRTDEIVDIVKASRSLELGCLPQEECWSLFAKIAFQGGQPPSAVIERVGRKIVQKCDGLPLAITAMASMLYSCSDLRKWKSIERDGIWKTEQENARHAMANLPTILPALRLSYEYLPNHLKQCFIFCCIFPKGYIFDKRELAKLWVAEGYADSSEMGEYYFHMLKSRCFFQPLNIDNKDRCRVHDLFHDLAVSFSEQSSCRFEDGQPCSVPENCRHISIFCKDVQRPALAILKANKLRTILLPINHSRNFGQALDKIFCALKYLRVLDLNSTIMMELPESIGQLKLLRYLDLSGTEIRRLPDSISKLIHLQTLKLVGCVWLYELPKGFNALTSLWHLELDEMFWSKCTYIPPGIGALTKLKTLHFFRVGNDIMHGVQQLQNMNSLTGKLHISELENTNTTSAACLKEKECLEELVLEWSDGNANLQDPSVQETVLRELEPHSNLKVLQICRYKGCTLPAWISNATLENLTEVSLRSCVNINILSLGPLPHIKKVYLKGMQNLEEWPQMEYDTLDWLQITNCPKLKTLPIFFLSLRVMKIKTCDVLNDLPVAPFLRFLILIDNVMLENWNEGALTTEERNAEEGTTTTTELPTYIHLLEMQIKNCPRLGGLPNHFAPQKLEISGCPLVQTLPVEKYSQRLQHLALEGCNDGTLVEAIPTTSSAYSLVISKIAKLISLPASISLSGLQALYIHDCEDLESLSNDSAPLSGFTSLVLLSVCGCPKLTILANFLLPSSLVDLIIKKCSKLRSFGPQNSLVSLTALRNLQMEDCPDITCFPEGGLPPSLKQLSIQRCPQLSRRFNDGGLYDRMLAHIADADIDSIPLS